MSNISVIIVDKSITDLGILCNMCGVLGLSIGKKMPTKSFGVDAIDGDGTSHPSLTNIGHHVRKAGQSKLATLRNTFNEDPNVEIVDYTEDAAPSDYETYMETLLSHKGNEIIYRGIWIYGPEGIIVPLTKNLSRL